MIAFAAMGLVTGFLLLDLVTASTFGWRLALDYQLLGPALLMSGCHVMYRRR